MPTDDALLPLKALAAYSGFSYRTLQRFLALPADRALPCYRVGRKVLVRKSDFDSWLEAFRVQGPQRIAAHLRAMGLAPA